MFFNEEVFISLACSAVHRNAGANLLLSPERFDSDSWLPTKLTLVPSAVEAPNKEYAGWLLVETDAFGVHNLNQPVSGGFTNGDKYTFSVFVKPNGKRYFELSSFHAVNATDGRYSVFDMQDGVVHASDAEGSCIDRLSDGWFKVSHVVSIDSAEQYPTSLICGLSLVDPTGRTYSYAGDGSSGVYVWGARLEKAEASTSSADTTA